MKVLFLVFSFYFISSQTVSNAWYPWEPYQYLDKNQKLTGLDIELLRELFSKINLSINYKKAGWNSHLDSLKNGKLDIAAGAIKTNEREKYAYFSDPYRSENIVMYYRNSSAFNIDFNSTTDLLNIIKRKSVKIGIIKGYQFNDEHLNRFINSKKNAYLINFVENDIENFQKLLNETSDVILADRLVSSSLVWKYGWQKRVKMHPNLISSAKIHVMFSKSSVDSLTVKSFNLALHNYKESGSYQELIRKYISPIMLNMTVGQAWFYWIDILGTIAFALSGIILARDEKYDLTGAFVLSTLPAIGGGTLRDLILGRELMILKNPIYLYLIISLVLLGFFFFKLYEKLSEKDREQMRQMNHVFWNIVVKLFDALGLAAFTITGVVVAFEAAVKPFWVWGSLMAMLTGAGGGILRDIVRADANNPSLKGSFYPEIALIWGFILSILIDLRSRNLNPDEIFYIVISVMVLTFISRLLVIKLKIRSPLY